MVKKQSIALALALVSTVSAFAQETNAYDPPPPRATVNLHEPGTACVAPAAEYHQVNPQILEAILRVESNLNPNTVVRNTNNSIDVGIAGINSIHFKELGKFGIGPSDLLKPCIGIYVAAWHLAKQYRKFGNTWWAVGAYHSNTPEHNTRYQSLVATQIRKMGISLQDNSQKKIASARQSLQANATY